MKVKSIETALAFLLDWAGRSDIQIPPRQEIAGCPSALGPLVAVSDALGPKFYDWSHGSAPLLQVQDTIFRPEEVHIRDGIRLLVAENQGVWVYGYKDQDPDRLYVSGDWCDRLGTREPESWRPVDATPEDALIATTMINGIFGLSERFRTEHTEDFANIPPETDVLIWKHPAWIGWPGIWTNEAGTLLHFGGMGLTLNRAS